MSKFSRFIYSGLLIILISLLIGCSTEKEREIENYSYLDYEAINHLENPRKNGVYDKYEGVRKRSKR